MNFKSEKGMTTKSVVIIIFILIILVGVVIYGLNRIIKEQEAESLKTNMLIIQAKSKEYCENAKTKLGANPTDETRESANEYLQEFGSVSYESLDLDISKFNLENTENLYLLTTDSFEKMGIEEIQSNEKSGYYFVKFDIENENVEVFNTKGFIKNGTTYYSSVDIGEN